MNALLADLTQLLSNNMHYTPLLAFLAGIVASFTPCCLASVPLIIAYVGGFGDKKPRNAFYLSLAFALGSTFVFMLFGLVAALVGSFFDTHNHYWHLIVGTLMIIMALQTFGLYQFIPKNHLRITNPKKGYLGAFIAGIIAGIFSSPCSTPVIIVLILLSIEQASVFYGILLFFLYSLGHGILSVCAGTSTGFMQRISEDARFSKIGQILKFIMGLIILLIGFYMFYIGF